MERSEEWKGLEDILKEYFGCEKPALKKPKKVEFRGDERYDYLTVKGYKAYGELVQLLYDLRNLGVLSDDACDDVIDELDAIVSSGGY